MASSLGGSAQWSPTRTGSPLGNSARKSEFSYYPIGSGPGGRGGYFTAAQIRPKPTSGTKPAPASAPFKGSPHDEWLASYNPLGGRVNEVGGTAGRGLFYNPAGKVGGWQDLTPAALEDPTVFGNVSNMFKTSADQIWGDLLGQASEAAKQKAIGAGVKSVYEGSQNTLAPEVLKKMWR